MDVKGIWDAGLEELCLRVVVSALADSYLVIRISCHCEAGVAVGNSALTLSELVDVIHIDLIAR